MNTLILIENAFTSLLLAEDLVDPSSVPISGELSHGGGLARRKKIGMDQLSHAMSPEKMQEMRLRMDEQVHELVSKIWNMLYLDGLVPIDSALEKTRNTRDPFSVFSNLWDENDLLIMKMVSVRKGQRLLGRCLSGNIPMNSHVILFCLLRNISLTLEFCERNNDLALIHSMDEYLLNNAPLSLIIQSMEAFLFKHPITNRNVMEKIVRFSLFLDGTFSSIICTMLKRTEKLRADQHERNASPSSAFCWQKYDGVVIEVVDFIEKNTETHRQYAATTPCNDHGNKH